MLYIKKKETARGIRYYREDRSCSRSFPIAKTKAESLLATGEAKLVDWFCTPNDIAAYGEYVHQQEQNADNVVSLADIRAKKVKEREDIETVNRFKTEILPYMSQGSLLTLADAAVSGDTNVFRAELTKVLLTVGIERMLSK